MSVTDLSRSVCVLSGGALYEEATCDCSRGACVALISVNPDDPHQNRSVSSVCVGPLAQKLDTVQVTVPPSPAERNSIMFPASPKTRSKQRQSFWDFFQLAEFSW